MNTEEDIAEYVPVRAEEEMGDHPDAPNAGDLGPALIAKGDGGDEPSWLLIAEQGSVTSQLPEGVLLVEFTKGSMPPMAINLWGV